MNSDAKQLRRVPLAVIFDLDDTLLDTQLAIDEALHPALEAQNLSPEDFNRNREEYKNKTGHSLDAYAYVTERVGEAAWQTVAAQYAERGKDLNLWLKGAQEAFSTLQKADIPFGIKTYGSDEMQQLKRQAMAIDETVPFHVINHRNKGEMLSTMYSPEHEGFEVKWLGDFVASRVVMFENDPSAFKGLEGHIEAGRVQAIWVPHTEGDRQKEVPVGVTEVPDIATGMKSVAEWSHDARLAA